MRIPRPPHRWNVSPARAVEIQRGLARRVKHTKPGRPVRSVAGIDVAFDEDGVISVAAAVVWDLIRGEVVEQRIATKPLVFPYIPGLLSFREAPVVLAALRKLQTIPDALICDGQGYAHPRRFGLACHVGVLAGLPAVGCGKSRLCGEHREPGRRRGSRADLVHRGEVIGSVLRTREGVRPVYVSVGHRVDLPTAERIVLDCGAGYRLPEPTRLADRLVAAVKRDAMAATPNPVRGARFTSSRLPNLRNRNETCNGGDLRASLGIASATEEPIVVPERSRRAGGLHRTGSAAGSRVEFM